MRVPLKQNPFPRRRRRKGSFLEDKQENEKFDKIHINYERPNIFPIETSFNSGSFNPEEELTRQSAISLINSMVLRKKERFERKSMFKNFYSSDEEGGNGEFAKKWIEESFHLPQCKFRKRIEDESRFEMPVEEESVDPEDIYEPYEEDTLIIGGTLEGYLEKGMSRDDYLADLIVVKNELARVKVKVRPPFQKMVPDPDKKRKRPVEIRLDNEDELQEEGVDEGGNQVPEILGEDTVETVHISLFASDIQTLPREENTSILTADGLGKILDGKLTDIKQQSIEKNMIDLKNFHITKIDRIEEQEKKLVRSENEKIHTGIVKEENKLILQSKFIPNSLDQIKKNQEVLNDKGIAFKEIGEDRTTKNPLDQKLVSGTNLFQNPRLNLEIPEDSRIMMKDDETFNSIPNIELKEEDTRVLEDLSPEMKDRHKNTRNLLVKYKVVKPIDTKSENSKLSYSEIDENQRLMTVSGLAYLEESSAKFGFEEELQKTNEKFLKNFNIVPKKITIKKNIIDSNKEVPIKNTPILIKMHPFGSQDFNSIELSETMKEDTTERSSLQDKEKVSNQNISELQSFRNNNNNIINVYKGDKSTIALSKPILTRSPDTALKRNTAEQKKIEILSKASAPPKPGQRPSSRSRDLIGQQPLSNFKNYNVLEVLNKSLNETLYKSKDNARPSLSSSKQSQNRTHRSVEMPRRIKKDEIDEDLDKLDENGNKSVVESVESRYNKLPSIDQSRDLSEFNPPPNNKTIIMNSFELKSMRVESKNGKAGEDGSVSNYMILKDMIGSGKGYKDPKNERLVNAQARIPEKGQFKVKDIKPDDGIFKEKNDIKVKEKTNYDTKLNLADKKPIDRSVVNKPVHFPQKSLEEIGPLDSAWKPNKNLARKKALNQDEDELLISLGPDEFEKIRLEILKKSTLQKQAIEVESNFVPIPEKNQISFEKQQKEARIENLGEKKKALFNPKTMREMLLNNLGWTDDKFDEDDKLSRNSKVN